jgi:hypothetical protein
MHPLINSHRMRLQFDNLMFQHIYVLYDESLIMRFLLSIQLNNLQKCI